MVETSNIGINLDGVSYYSTEFPFIDRMKTASSWALLGGDDSTIQLNKDGYPLAIPAGFSNVYEVVGLDPLSAGTDSTYVLTYTGAANFELLGGKVLSSEPGKIVFQYTNADTNQMPIKVSGLDSSSPLTAIHIVRSDQQALFAAGEIFNPAFTDKISQYSTLRYMDWSGTNASNVSNWADRTQVSAATWGDNGNASVPIEVMVDLANQTKTNMWLNVPTKASDDYVRQMMTYVHAHLDPSLSVNLEYSNEVWNFGFQQSNYAAQQGAKLWDVDANGDGVINPNDPAEHNSADWVEYYGYRAAQVANIANQVYGGDASRLHNVLSTQTSYTGLENYILDGVSRANVGSVSSLFNDYAITTYFGNLDGASDADKATILSWAKSGDAGVTAAFAALKDGTGVSSTGSLASLVPIYAYQAAVAAKEGLKLVAYEGGIGLTALNYAPADQQTVLALFKKLNADPRMGDLYKQMISDFSAAGGTLLNNFNDAGPDSVWGTWGALKSIYDQGGPAWDALVAAEQAVAGTNAPVTTGTSTTTSTGSTPVTTGSADRFFFQIGDLDLNADPTKTDTITDFSSADGDKIDLSGYDANPSTAKRDAFTFIGKAKFSKHAGELRVDQGGGAYQVISGDLNGDGVADFTLRVSKSAGTLIATDFVL